MAMYKVCRCGKLITTSIEYCSNCSKEIDQERKYKLKRYKINRTDKKEQRFYNTKTWKELSKYIKTSYINCCVRCLLKDKELRESEYTHHIIELKEDWSKRIDEDNLIPLCDSCHKQIHSEYLISENKMRETQKELKIMLNVFKEKYLK